MASAPNFDSDPTSASVPIAAGVAAQPQMAQIEPDDAVDDEGYVGSTLTSYVTSIASTIRRGVEEKGRVYAAYGQHKSWLPIDEAEMDRNDLQHCKFSLLMNGLHLAPIKSNPQKILDLGTGTGIWALDMADKYGSAEVIGVDTAPIQPTWVPPNLQFEIEDVEKDWLYAPQSFDFIHARELVMAVRDWPRLIRQAYTGLKPGGYLELSGSVPEFTSDDNTLPSNCAYLEVAQIYFDMADRIGCSGRTPSKWKIYLGAAGFMEVTENIFKIPTNPWPKDKRLKQIGAFELQHFQDGIANIFARGYEQILGGDPAYFEVLMARAREEVLDRKRHSYLPFYVVYGRRPE